MRVALVTHDPPPRPGDASASALEHLATSLREQGVDAAVVRGPEPAPEGDALLAALRRPGGWLALGRYHRALRRAAEAQLAAGADLFHAHSWFPAGLAAPLGVPLVITAYDSDAAVLGASRLARRFALPVFERAQVVSAASREVADIIQTLTGRHVDRTRVQPMPVAADDWPWTRGGGGAITVASLTPRNRVELAIETVAVLASCGHALPLTIIGDGPLRDQLARTAHVNGVDTLVHFAGALSPEAIRQRLASADLMLHPAQADAAAPWVIGAALAGVPIVACWDGGAAVGVVPESGAGRLTLPSTEALSDAALGLLMEPDRLDAARLVGESWRSRLVPGHVADVCAGWYRDALSV